MPDKAVAIQAGRVQSLKIYFILALAIIALAALLAILPSGTQAQRCGGIIMGQSRDLCFMQLALSQNNQSLCAYIKGAGSGPCYASIGEAKLNQSLCAKAGSLGYNCLEFIANATSNPAYCSGIQGQQRDACTLAIAVKALDFRACPSISNASKAEVCNISISLDIAAAAKSPALCAKLPIQTNTSVLSSVLSQTSSIFARSNLTTLQTNIDTLPFIPGSNYSARDICYAIVGVGTQNQSACKSISGAALGSICSYLAAGTASSQVQTANYSQLISECSNAGQYSYVCVQYAKLAFALSTRNVSICSSFSNSTALECYEGLAANYHNASYCGYIKNSTDNNDCLLQLTNSTLNSTG
ncbi:MAG: hypothetical protein KGH61_01530 [Candidatus Micrarchaeota archaeon]|nr:hypothetical protein [Candidatus Micrarchaeota archaeon]MDE1847612.1 hypothetical protein [Candidatus Micrarchaeota archaeon]MDE1863815.1 hypothetical protein [Candidatus Micrarchaeota archaeon]